jgi:methyl-accepting chemotaxis protein
MERVIDIIMIFIGSFFLGAILSSAINALIKRHIEKFCNLAKINLDAKIYTLENEGVQDTINPILLALNENMQNLFWEYCIFFGIITFIIAMTI